MHIQYCHSKYGCLLLVQVGEKVHLLNFFFLVTLNYSERNSYSDMQSGG